MQFGNRQIEADEPVLYFENIAMSMLSEQSKEVYARGGWLNQPKVIWQDRSEIRFQMSEGVVSQFGFGILLGAKVALKGGVEKPILMHKTEGPFSFTIGEEEPAIELQHMPVAANRKKTFIFEFDRNAVQRKVYGQIVERRQNLLGEECPKIRLYKDKYPFLTEEQRRQLFKEDYEGDLSEAQREKRHWADTDKKYVVDYYYEYGDEAISYTLQKERFNGLFTLEGKFYSKDENDGKNYTNILYMPKVRIVSDINLRLGERADPTVSAFDIIGLPETVGDDKDLIVEIQHLGEDLDADI